MTQEIQLLLGTAFSIGFVHTLFGPDHYIPFIVMARSGEWSMKKTALITTLCGIGHVVGSIALGLLGIALGISVTRLESVEGFRGNLAAWALIAFGLVYFAWGLRQSARNRPHTHSHLHGDGSAHGHEHSHTGDHLHAHGATRSMTPWILFTIFLFGPCEPLIPLLMYPAAEHSMGGTAMVAGAFGFATIGTMLGVVIAGSYGVNFLPLRTMERYTHALAGGSILLCGLAIQFLGL